MNHESHEAQIRRTRDSSNRAIARRNLLGVADSLAEDYMGIIGDGTFVPLACRVSQVIQGGLRSSQAGHDLRADARGSPPGRRSKPRRRARQLGRNLGFRLRRLHRLLRRHVASNLNRLEDPIRDLRHPSHQVPCTRKFDTREYQRRLEPGLFFLPARPSPHSRSLGAGGRLQPCRNKPPHLPPGARTPSRIARPQPRGRFSY